MAVVGVSLALVETLENLVYLVLWYALARVMESIIPLERVKVESGRRMAGPGRVVLFVPEEERLLMC